MTSMLYLIMRPRQKSPNPAASALGKLSAKARMVKIPPEERKAIARNAANARWTRWRQEHKKSSQE